LPLQPERTYGFLGVVKCVPFSFPGMIRRTVRTAGKRRNRVSTSTMPDDRPASTLLTGIDDARRPTGPVLGLVVVLLCLLVGPVLVALVLGLLGVALPHPRGGLALPAQLVLTSSFLGALLLLAIWMRAKERRSFVSVGLWPASRIGAHLALGAVVAFAMMTLTVLPNVLFGQFVLDGLRATQIFGVLLALVGFAVQAGTEEVMIRGYLMQTLCRKWGLPAAITLQALVFMALHGVNAGFGIVAMVNLVLVAVMWAFWALAEGSLWGVCAFHAVWNWCQGNVYGIEVSGMNLQTTVFDVHSVPGSAEWVTGGAFGVEGSLIATVLLMIGLAVAVAGFRRRTA
jgi:uncharacterized protein